MEALSPHRSRHVGVHGTLTCPVAAAALAAGVLAFSCAVAAGRGAELGAGVVGFWPGAAELPVIGWETLPPWPTVVWLLPGVEDPVTAVAEGGWEVAPGPPGVVEPVMAAALAGWPSVVAPLPGVVEPVTVLALAGWPGGDEEMGVKMAMLVWGPV